MTINQNIKVIKSNKFNQDFKMSIKRFRHFILLLVVIFGSLSPSTVQSQNIWLSDTANSISIEILKPQIKELDFSFLSTAIFLSGRHRIKSNITINWELPLANAKIDEPFFEESEFILGNIFVGFAIDIPNKPSWLELGLHFPTSPNDKPLAFSVGLFSDFHRLESFLTDYLILPIIFNTYKRNETNFFYRFRVGADIWINTGDNDESELLFDYGGQIGFETTKYNVKLGITGLAILTESDLDFSERTTHLLGLSANINLGKVIPGISLKVPIDDDLNDVIDATIGLGMAIKL